MSSNTRRTCSAQSCNGRHCSPRSKRLEVLRGDVGHDAGLRIRLLHVIKHPPHLQCSSYYADTMWPCMLYKLWSNAVMQPNMLTKVM